MTMIETHLPMFIVLATSLELGDSVVFGPFESLGSASTFGALELDGRIWSVQEVFTPAAVSSLLPFLA